MRDQDQPFPYPDASPLKRLYVHDGLMMNAERWKIDRHYHRQRQNIHYQALYQPGIVYGLGVRVIDPPQNTLLHHRNIDQQQQEKRWIEIQPGVAIDVEGNPIIVDSDTDRTYRIAIDPPTEGRLTVYVVVSYVDPDHLDYQPSGLTIPEQFRFDQKTEHPSDRELELCRIELSPERIALKLPSDPFNPGVNELNLLHRQKAQPRSQNYVKMGVLNLCSNPYTSENCDYLLRSLPALYPSLQGAFSSGKLVDPASSSQCNACDLLYTNISDMETLKKIASESVVKSLKQYLKTGGLLIIETPEYPELEPRIQEFFQVFQSQETAIQKPISNQVLTKFIAHQSLSANHPIKTQPFLFSQLPRIQGKSVQIGVNEGVVWIKGELSQAWGIQQEIPRSEIRSAQELGINLLQFARNRRHLTQLMQWK